MKHQYFYMPYNNIYYDYDGKTYKIIKDDDIHHHLLSTITDEGKLMPWKHKTKQNIIKQIKENYNLESQHDIEISNLKLIRDFFNDWIIPSPNTGEKAIHSASSRLS